MRPIGLNNKRCLDLRGKKFGLLSPMEIDATRKGRVFWKCCCNCGNIKSVASKHLVAGMVTSCGCNQHKKGNKSPSWRGHKEISKKYWESCRHGATRRELKFSITSSYAWNKFIEQGKRCALTGVPLQFQSQSTKADGNASLDRIDSSKGYVEGNIWWVDKNVNTIKWDLPFDIFLKTCKLVVEHNKL